MSCRNTRSTRINLTQNCNPCTSCNRCACDCTCSLPDYCNDGCLTNQPTDCTYYSGNAYATLGVSVKESLTSVLEKIMDVTNQDADANLKFEAVLAALNDINDRLNAVEGGTPHDPYTLNPIT